MNPARLRIDCGERGCSIWIDGRWILDASCFQEDEVISFDMNRLKLGEPDGSHGKLIYKHNEEVEDLKAELKRLKQKLEYMEMSD